MKPPCKKDCLQRSEICHGICEEWLEYEKARNQMYEERKKEHDLVEFLAYMEKRRKKNIAIGKQRARRSKI